MEFKITREQVKTEISKMNLSPYEQKRMKLRERILSGLDLSDVARCLSSRLEDYVEEWLQEEVDRFLEETEATRRVIAES